VCISHQGALWRCDLVVVVVVVAVAVAVAVVVVAAAVVVVVENGLWDFAELKS